MNHADICRECDLERRCSELSIEVVSAWEQNRALEEAGNTLSNRIADVLDGILDESALEDAVGKWKEAKDEPKCPDYIELEEQNKALKQTIADLINAIRTSTHCTTCMEEFGGVACSECAWGQAEARALGLLLDEED